MTDIRMPFTTKLAVALLTNLAAMAQLVVGQSTSAENLNLIANGSFEQGALTPTRLVYAPYSGITGWEVFMGSIDYMNDFFIASDGTRMIDLSGLEPAVPGAIRQTFPTIPHQTYNVIFDL